MNARLREMLSAHWGLSVIRRVKAIFWWYYMHTVSPLPLVEMLRAMPTDDQVQGLFSSTFDKRKRVGGAPEEYGQGIDWSDFRMPTQYRQ